MNFARYVHFSSRHLGELFILFVKWNVDEHFSVTKDGVSGVLWNLISWFIMYGFVRRSTTADFINSNLPSSIHSVKTKEFPKLSEKIDCWNLFVFDIKTSLPPQFRPAKRSPSDFSRVLQMPIRLFNVASFLLSRVCMLVMLWPCCKL